MSMSRLAKAVGLLAVALVLLTPLGASADTLSPSSISKTLKVGDTYSFTKTLTVSKGTPTAAMVDIFFLADTTGSMGGVISSVKTGASDIMNATKSLGDVSYAVGEYKDVGDTFVYKLDQNFTKTTSLVQTGINAWSATGGGDLPEANLYALYTAADAAWRPGATHILVWFGDAPGHDPTQGGVTVTSATNKLKSKNIKVEALNTTTSTYSNLNTWSSDTKLSNQATKITSATGGTYFSSVSATNVVQKIKDSITAAFQKYNTVALDLSGVPSGLTVTSSPAKYTGTYDRSVARNFNFNVSVKATKAGTYNFNLYGLVDGGRVATEKDIFTVNAAFTNVALELILAVDVSGSIDTSEYNLQKNGYINAFKDPNIIAKIQKAGPIAVAYVEWAGGSQHKTVVDWMLVKDAATATAFANKMAAATRSYSGNTAPGSALQYSYPLFNTNTYVGTKKIIDISGDGILNEGVAAAAQRDAALKAGVTTINALAIDAPTGQTGTYDWYVKNVIGGKDPFAFKVKDFTDFSRAVTAKISQEIIAEYARFNFTYYYANTTAGEYYKGYVYAPSDYYKVGYKQTVAKDENGKAGYYLITAESAPSATYKSYVGKVYVTDYYDLESKQHFTKASGANALVNLGKPVGSGYLGTETSFIVATTSTTYRFGQYGTTFYEADVPIDSGKFGFRFDYGNGDYYTGYFYGKYSAYNVGWTKETSAGVYTILNKAYYTVPSTKYGYVYLDRYYDTLSKKAYVGATLISMFDGYYGSSYLGSECGWVIKAYTYPKYRFFGFGYYEAEGI